MVSSGVGPLVTLGMIVGLVGSGAMMYYNGKRTADTSERGWAARAVEVCGGGFSPGLCERGHSGTGVLP